MKSISRNGPPNVNFSIMHPCNNFGLWTVNKKLDECVTLHSNFLEMSYELNIKMKCLAPLHLGDVKNFLIPPRILPPYGRLISGQKSTNSTLFKFLGNDTPGTHLCYNEGSGILGSGRAFQQVNQGNKRLPLEPKQVCSAKTLIQAIIKPQN